ncbi:DNA polymerase alpha, subunit B [Piedraia hortae CBS 480.64]|uniref:DNA polymerase alpha subunit B n=1 Tax=Piedraia hortae CBS 480.64 TaxID=1314780 RepID=A0A6A7C7H8_9PEZI|nr:DNA polymerase alpha, subunit B [Piedraia hortae CBS 480.64]
MASTDSLHAAFGAQLELEVTSELQHISRLLELSAQELFFKWESYVLKMGVDTTSLNVKTVRDFKKDLQDALERETRSKGPPVPHSAVKKSTVTPRGKSDVFGMLDGMASVTPGPAKRKNYALETPVSKSIKATRDSSPATRTPTTPGANVAFGKRARAGEVEQSINHQIPAAKPPETPPTAPRVTLKANVELPKFAYKTMAMKLSEASEILDDRIDTFTELVQAHHKLPDSAFGNPAAQSSAEIVAVGRIACDQANGRLNAESVVLETSRRMGAGLRIPLKFAQGLGYDLFPGKITAVKGTNVGGGYFTVAEILDVPLLGPPASTPAELDIHKDRLVGANGDARPLQILVASGPFTTDLDFSFATFHSLLEKARENVVDVLLLSGPFIDLEHPIVASGDFEAHIPPEAKLSPDRSTLQDVFRLMISEPLQQLSKAVPSITIILVPSVRDAASGHVSWPQDRFFKAPLGLPKNVQVVANPMLMSINEMVVGVGSQDILFELRKENVHRAASGGGTMETDFLERVTRHVIEQRHFYPIFPAQARGSLPPPTAIPGEVPSVDGEKRLPVGANLDLSYLKLGEWINVRPDILILPSILSPFVKVIEGVMCINPGSLCRKRGTGHFAILNILPRTVTDQEREDEAPLAHEVGSRARVDIVRT